MRTYVSIVLYLNVWNHTDFSIVNFLLLTGMSTIIFTFLLLLIMRLNEKPTIVTEQCQSLWKMKLGKIGHSSEN